jgi:hypothetical protein
MLFRISSVIAAVALAFSGTAMAACGDGSAQGVVTGSGTFTTNVNGANVYSGSDYRLAIQTALDRTSAGQRVVVWSSGNLGANSINVPASRTFEVCGTINAGWKNGAGAVQIRDVNDVNVPYLTMTGDPYFGLRISGTRNLWLGQITMNLSGGLGIRFDRDAAWNYNTKMDNINISGAGSHAVEVWNIDKLDIKSVIARNCGESGLLLQSSRNIWVGNVEGHNVAAGTGYATLRFANNNGQATNGQYTTTNVWIDRVYSRGGGRGIFCVSMSGATEIKWIDLANNGNNAVLIENCYNFAVRDGIINGGGEVRVSARSEFPNTSGIFFEVEVNNNSVRESPCAENIFWAITGNARKTVC